MWRQRLRQRRWSNAAHASSAKPAAAHCSVLLLLLLGRLLVLGRLQLVKWLRRV